MQTWTTIDKSSWEKGPWCDEPDKAHWICPETDFDCLIKRVGKHGALCGYVGIPPSHPCYHKDYNDIDYNEISAHGGLTFADFCQSSDDPALGICHVPLPGREPKVWWLGFDCTHLGDFQPGWTIGKDILQSTMDILNTNFDGSRSVYRDFDYVKSEVEKLAKLLKQYEKNIN